MSKVLSKKMIFSSKAFDVNETDIELSSGKHVTYHYADLGESSMIVPVDSNNNVILIKEFAQTLDNVQLGLPKGSVEKGLTPLENANKELQEETGFKAGKLDELAVLVITPNYINLKTHVFLARDLVESKLDGDEDEEIEVLPTPLDKIDELIVSGQITEARVIAAMYLAKKFLKK